MAENTEAKIWMSQFMLFLQLGCIPFSAIAWCRTSFDERGNCMIL
jgi:hypothetical protein